MKTEYIIIQAGGKGTRLKHLTANKPKGIVPINNLPMIFHLMKKFPDRKYIIIADYKYDVMEKYLEVFSPVDSIVVHATQSGTCAGIQSAISLIPNDKAFLLIWSDLIVGEDFQIDDVERNMIGLSVDFTCRWSYQNGVFAESPSQEYGVAGCFLFANKSCLTNVPNSGEFVRWLQEQQYVFHPFALTGTKEVGTVLAYEQNRQDNVCRPFNVIEEQGERLIKRGITEQGKKIAQYEVNWYKSLKKLGYTRIPKIYEYEPLVMEKVNGANIFKVSLTTGEKKTVIKNFVSALCELHTLDSCQTDYFALQENYYTKTMQRLDMVRNLIPYTDQETIVVNGVSCKNVFYYREEFKRLIEQTLYDTNFTLIHGDCTFSNTLIDQDLNITFIDPRGYFGKVLLYGDEYYDWAKLYYSLKGNYDQFNNKKFALDILKDAVSLSIDSNGYEELSDYFLSLIPKCKKEKIQLLHAIIWLSLTTYAWEDYDSICGAFYNGLLYLNECWSKNE